MLEPNHAAEIDRRLQHYGFNATWVLTLPRPGSRLQQGYDQSPRKRGKETDSPTSMVSDDDDAVRNKDGRSLLHVTTAAGHTRASRGFGESATRSEGATRAEDASQRKHRHCAGERELRSARAVAATSCSASPSPSLPCSHSPPHPNLTTYVTRIQIRVSVSEGYGYADTSIFWKIRYVDTFNN